MWTWKFMKGSVHEIVKQVSNIKLVTPVSWGFWT